MAKSYKVQGLLKIGNIFERDWIVSKYFNDLFSTIPFMTFFLFVIKYKKIIQNFVDIVFKLLVSYALSINSKKNTCNIILLAK